MNGRDPSDRICGSYATLFVNTKSESEKMTSPVRDAAKSTLSVEKWPEVVQMSYNMVNFTHLVGNRKILSLIESHVG